MLPQKGLTKQSPAQHRPTQTFGLAFTGQLPQIERTKNDNLLTDGTQKTHETYTHSPIHRPLSFVVAALSEPREA